MSEDGKFMVIVTLCGVLVTILGALIGLIWKASATSTSHELRIKSLEDGSRDTTSDLRRQIKGLESTGEKLKEAVWGLTTRLRVSQARASQGQFDQGETDPPRGEE